MRLIYSIIHDDNSEGQSCIAIKKSDAFQSGFIIIIDYLIIKIIYFIKFDLRLILCAIRLLVDSMRWC